jgi:DNA recombination protein RmuC
MTPLLAVFAAALAAAVSLLIATRGRVRELEEVAAAREAEAREERAARTRESAAAAAQKAQLEAERAAAADKLALVQDAERKLGESFEALSQRALRANNDQFLQLARESLGRMAQAANGDLEKRQIAIAEMVRPVRDSLEKVDEKIQKLENARTFAYASLSEQVRSLLETQKALRAETGTLV